MSARELLDVGNERLDRAESLEGEAVWLRIEGAAYKEAATRKLSANTSQTKATRKAQPRKVRAKARRPTAARAPGTSPRLPDGLTREQLPKFGLPRANDPTGQKEMILGALWITRGSPWSPRDLEDELERTGIVTMKRHMATTFLRRLAVSDPPLVIKLGEGRGTQYEVAPGIHPIEQADGTQTTS
jgi:predicted RNA-binding protein YlxR (DUF448 family)